MIRTSIARVVIPAIACAIASASAASPRDAVRQMPFEIVSNKPWVKVSINGSDPQTFILDTGCRGTSIIARECADRLGMKLGETNQTRLGAGQGVSVGFTRTKDVTLGVAGDTLSSPGLGVFPLAHVSPYEGRRVDGLLGEDFMRRHVVEIDYAQRVIRIHDPASYHYAGKAAPTPIEFHQGLAVAAAEMTPPGGEPIPCHVVIDTGVRTTVVWYHPFVLAHDLVATQPRVITGTIGGGAGGETKGDIGRLERLTIGDLTLVRPTVVFSRDTTGVFAGSGEDGIVGGELLRRCKVTFDYPDRQLFLEPYATPVADFDYDMSGLFLVSAGPDFKRVTIQSVADGTPAQEAGLVKGDEIVTVDGRKAGTLSLDQIRDLLKKDGATCVLGIARGEERREVRLKLRRLV